MSAASGAHGPFHQGLFASFCPACCEKQEESFVTVDSEAQELEDGEAQPVEQAAAVPSVVEESNLSQISGESLDANANSTPQLHLKLEKTRVFCESEVDCQDGDKSTKSNVSHSQLLLFHQKTKTKSLGSELELRALDAAHQAKLAEIDKQRLSGYIFRAENDMLKMLQSLQETSDLDTLSQVQRQTEYISLIDELQDVNELLGSLLEDSGWQLAKQGPQINVWTKQEPGEPLLTVRAAGIVKGPFENVCAIGKEVEMIKTWAPGVGVSKSLGKPRSHFEDIAYYLWKIPMVSGREFCMQRKYWIDDEKGFILVKLFNPLPDNGIADIPPESTSNPRADVRCWSNYITPVDDKRVFTVAVSNLDLKMPLPAWLMNYIAVTNGYNVITQMQSNVDKSLKPSSPYAKCLADPANAPFYDRIRALRNRQRAARDSRGKSGKQLYSAKTQEIVDTGWLASPDKRRELFDRDDGVLVPLPQK
eukprot:gnl/MRDRNA2_/MRDRNA2_17353_c0_seq1.p1 gnl/MRDRNA2_/MRDRNA2_17353_c0~~gnl/MRDRNA2_/MRDRNA2_17353_c0_seq1.p1  ORF type:complete len:477 (-),score=96.23 gnl/MRDRNA2_/MRDRNA2_17353_c0_seq1:40-1470(-)